MMNTHELEVSMIVRVTWMKHYKFDRRFNYLGIITKIRDDGRGELLFRCSYD